MYKIRSATTHYYHIKLTTNDLIIFYGPTRLYIYERLLTYRVPVLREIYDVIIHITNYNFQ